jgi:hypothetical protein
MGEAKRRRDAESLRNTNRPKNVCVICGRSEPVKSHLFPAAIAKDIRGEEKSLLIGSKDHDGRNFSQSGTWERMLCADHENEIHDYENYAIRFVREFKLTEVERSSGLFVRQNVDTCALVRFACSILWRFHTSISVEASRTYLPEWEPDLRAVTFDRDMNRAPDVIIGAHSDQLIPSNLFAYPPHRAQLGNRAVWQFVVHGIIFAVKLDRRPYENAAPIVLGVNRAVVGFVKPADSDERDAVRRIVKRMASRHPIRQSLSRKP